MVLKNIRSHFSGCVTPGIDSHESLRPMSLVSDAAGSDSAGYEASRSQILKGLKSWGIRSHAAWNPQFKTCPWWLEEPVSAGNGSCEIWIPGIPGPTVSDSMRFDSTSCLWSRINPTKAFLGLLMSLKGQSLYNICAKEIQHKPKHRMIDNNKACRTSLRRARNGLDQKAQL